MAMKARYKVVNGEVIAEKRGGVRKLYMPDPLGSTVALLDNTQTQTDTFTYWPYGEVRARNGTTATPFQYVGTLGYYVGDASKTYVRARYLDVLKGRWLTEDPIVSAGGNADRIASANSIAHCCRRLMHAVAVFVALSVQVQVCSAQPPGEAMGLLKAINSNDLGSVRRILKNGANPNSRSSKSHWTVLMYAAYKGNLSICSALIAGGADVNAAAPDHWTPLMLAATSGHANIVKALLNAGANANAQSKDGLTALMLGSMWGYVEIDKVLLRHGAVPNIRDIHGKTALDWATRKGEDHVVRSIIAERSADFAAVTELLKKATKIKSR